MTKFFKQRIVSISLSALTLTTIGLAHSRIANADDVNYSFMFGGKPLPANYHTATSKIPALIDLGRMLYYEGGLSKSGKISCNSCHDLARYGVDAEPTSPGHEGARGERNSPTALNAAGHFVQFWDGRAATVEEQAKGPMLNPGEMGMPSAAEVETFLKSSPKYVAAFTKAFPGDKNPVTFDHVATAIGAFERGLTTPSKFDKYLAGDMAALTAAEKVGVKTFVETGCASCHNGNLIGGSMYQKAGLIEPWPNQKDLGRFKVTNQESDKFLFKVPSLRNVEKTAPYFHDGSVASLDEAVKMMAKHQLGRALTDEQVQSIVTFLRTLTGTVDAKYAGAPKK